MPKNKKPKQRKTPAKKSSFDPTILAASIVQKATNKS